VSCIVSIDLDAYDRLPPRQLKAMLRALRFADEEGVVHATLSMLAMPGLSRSTAHRELAGLEDAGHVERQQRPEGGFLWRIGQRFRSRPARQAQVRVTGGHAAMHHGAHPPDGTPVPAAETPVPQRGTTDSRATPARLELSSGSKEPSERELSPQALSQQQDEIPIGWEEAAAAERRLAGLGPVNLRTEWRKLVAYSEGQRITIWRWRGWELKARCDRVAEAAPVVADSDSPARELLPGDNRERRQARDWVRRGFWLRDGSWGPAPDQPNCTLPAALIAWCLRERAQQAA